MIADRQIISGEMHYARIPRAYWRVRLEMAYAMGLDAVSTYVFWNLHEPRPGRYDFDGENDVAEYLRTAAACGLDVILRPGPYVCSEWDFGGLPAWLLADESLQPRTTHESFLSPSRRWLRRLGEELAPLLRSHGGPILAVQLENEYGAFGSDAAYLRALRAAFDDAGFGSVPYFTIDQPTDLRNGALADVAMGVTFGPGDAERAIAALRELRPDSRPYVGEYWDGWFDHWGARHAQRDDDVQTNELAWMLRDGCSLNLYMFCGGTNFGFTNGANVTSSGEYAPVTTSYDYLAPLDEAGRPTPKYFAFRDVIARHRRHAPRPVPATPELIEVPPFILDRCAPMTSLLADAIEADRPTPMESFDQAYGFVLYRTHLAQRGGTLEIDGLHDYATILIDGELREHLDRRLNQTSCRIDAPAGATLELLVENCGRVNYGDIAGERKGILGDVRWNDDVLRDWSIVRLPLDGAAATHDTHERRPAPAFHSGTFDVAHPGDTFIDTRALGKGVLFVNGRNAGRYWNVGPQRTLYVPAAWLRQGRNEIVAFDVTPLHAPAVAGLRQPVYA